MKKKIVFITLVVALMSCLLILTACGQIGFSGGDASISDDYNSQEVQAKMETMKNGDGFKFVFEGTGTGAAAGEADTVRFTYGAKGNIYYMATDGEETYWDLSGESSFAIYTKEVGDDNNAYWTKSIYSYTEDYTKEDAKQQLSLEATGVLGWMTYYGTASFDGGMSKSTETLVGRSCDKYSWSVNAIVYSMEYACYIDKETGICLKWTYNASAMQERAGVNFECKEFNTNPTFTLPTVSEANTSTQEASESTIDSNINGRTGGDENNGTNIGGDGESGKTGDNTGKDGDTSNANTADKTILKDHPADLASVIDALLTNGFFITYDLTANVQGSSKEYYTFAGKGEKFYIRDTSGDQIYVDFSESDSYYVLYRIDDGKWIKETQVYEDVETTKEEVMEGLTTAINTWMVAFSYTLDGKYTKSAGKFLNRDIDMYVSNTTGTGYHTTQEIGIDKATDVVLIYKFNGSYNGQVMANVAYCATEFKASYNIVLPTDQQPVDGGKDEGGKPVDGAEDKDPEGSQGGVNPDGSIGGNGQSGNPEGGIGEDASGGNGKTEDETTTTINTRYTQDIESIKQFFVPFINRGAIHMEAYWVVDGEATIFEVESMGNNTYVKYSERTTTEEGTDAIYYIMDIRENRYTIYCSTEDNIESYEYDESGEGYYWLDVMGNFFGRLFVYKDYDSENCYESEETLVNRGVYKYYFEDDEDYYEFQIDKGLQINLSYELGAGDKFTFRMFDTSEAPEFDVPAEKE